MARKVETLTVFLSHNISLQLSNSEGGGGNSYVRTLSSQMRFFFFFKREIYCWDKGDSDVFFLMGNNGFNCLEVSGPLGRKCQADKQEQSNAPAR